MAMNFWRLVRRSFDRAAQNPESNSQRAGDDSMTEIAATTAAWPATVPQSADSTVRHEKPEEAAAWTQAGAAVFLDGYYGKAKDVLDKLDIGQAVET
jgi:G:T/U-mismatch repair DNA glycosylase